jgi:serine/threonine-protein kinase RsbW
MPKTNAIELTFPADLKYLNIVSLAIGGLLEHAAIAADAKETTIYNIQLAVHEVCTNIIEHAYKNDASQRVHLQMNLHPSGKGITIELTDTSGSKFDTKAVSAPDAEGLQVRGYGMFLVEQLMDKVDYQHHADYNRWTLSKTFN